MVHCRSLGLHVARKGKNFCVDTGRGVGPDTLAKDAASSRMLGRMGMKARTQRVRVQARCTDGDFEASGMKYEMWKPGLKI